MGKCIFIGTSISPHKRPKTSFEHQKQLSTATSAPICFLGEAVAVLADHTHSIKQYKQTGAAMRENRHGSQSLGTNGDQHTNQSHQTNENKRHKVKVD